MTVLHDLGRAARFGAAALLAGAAACSSGEARDAAPASSHPTAWTVADSATLRIGGSEADALVSVTDAIGLPGGGVAIADAGTHRIDVFDARGRRVRTMGRKGRGPGEFSHPSWIGRRGDTLRVWDMAEARLTLYDTAGRFIRTEPPVTDLGSFPRVAGQFADGSLLLMSAKDDAWRTGPFRDSLLLIRADMAAGTRDTLGRVPGDEQVGSRSPDGRGAVTSTRPFGRRTLVAVRGDRLYLGTGDTPAILSSSDGKAWTQALAVPGKPQRITRRDIDDYWAGIIVRGSGAGSREEPPEGIEYPAEYPPYGDLVAAAGTDLWVHLPARPSEWGKGSRWVVFAGDGSLRGSVYVPGRTRVLEIGDGWILVSQTGEDDQELVARYSLAAPRS
jgi:hypothetical protein